MNSLWIAANIVRRMIGNRKGFLFLIIIPVVVISFITLLFSSSTSGPIQIAYVNLDQGKLGAMTIEDLQYTNKYVMVQLQNEKDIKEQLISRTIGAAFVIPASYTEQVQNGMVDPITLYRLSETVESFTLQMNLENTTQQWILATQAAVDSQKANTVMLTEQAQQIQLDELYRQLKQHQISTITTKLDIPNNEGLTTIVGFMLLFLMGSISSAVTAIVEDRNLHTMARIYTAPVRSYEIAAGNFIGSFGVGMVQVMLTLLTTTYLLGYDYGVGFGPLFIMLTLFMLASMGIATAVAGTVKTASQVSIINNLIVTPTCMIGGCFWPLSIMPDFMQKIANFVPQKWVLEAVTNMASGDTLWQMGMPIIILILFAAIFLSFGAVILRPAER